jgi:uncharacterized protein (DUF1800 family)
MIGNDRVAREMPAGRIVPGMNRAPPPLRPRYLLLAAWALGIAGCASDATGPQALAPLPRAHAPWSEAIQQADPVLLANRLTWGATAADVEAIRARGAGDWIDRQLRPGPVRPLAPEVQRLVDAMTIEQRPVAALVRDMEARRKSFDAAGEGGDREKARKDWQEEMNRLSREAASRQVLRAVHAPDQVREQMTWFWMNHFSVFQHKHLNRALVGDYEAQLRAASMGRFEGVLLASVLHPAMVAYLDNAQNAAGHVNENYARELLELHTLGIDGGYTQHDVQELARVLTGLGFSPGARGKGEAEGLTAFRARRHDPSDKDLLGRHVHGQKEGELAEVIELLASHPSTARHVSRQLIHFWVGDAPASRLEDEVTREFLRTRGDIPSVLRSIFDSPEFLASLGHRFKDPVHYVVSAVRLESAGRPLRDTAPILAWINRLGEGFANHSTPDGYALDDSDWNGPGQLAVRLEVARGIANGGAGLFRETGPQGGAQAPPSKVERIEDAFVRGTLEPRMAPQTRAVLAQASSPREWNQLLLSTPEFMMR